MKTKLISSIILATAVAGSAFAEGNYYELTSSNNVFTGTIPSNILSNYNGVTGEPFVFEVSTLPADYATNSKSRTLSFTVGKFTSDFTFDSGIKFQTPSTYVTDMTLNPKFFVNNGATITVNDTITYNVRSKTRFWIDNDAGAYGTVVINAPVTRIDKNDGAKNTALANCELFVNRGHVVLNATTDFGYTSLYGGCSITVRENSTATTFAIRAARSNTLYTKDLPTAIKEAIAGKKGIRENGSLILDGANYEVKSASLNSFGDEKDCADYAHIFTLKYSQANVAESLMVKGFNVFLTDASNGSKGMDAFIVEDMDYLDTICTNTNLAANTYASKIYINGVCLSDLIADGTVVVSTQSGDYTNVYTYIPEPSTYAMIFGAIALGFVAYRRRK